MMIYEFRRGRLNSRASRPFTASSNVVKRPDSQREERDQGGMVGVLMPRKYGILLGVKKHLTLVASFYLGENGVKQYE